MKADWIVKPIILFTLMFSVPGTALLISPANIDRITHARELMGKKTYAQIFPLATPTADVDRFVRRKIAESLPSRWQKEGDRVSDALLEESNRRGIDPILVLALIEHESGFNPHAVGRRGAMGLMQVMPATGKWVAKKFHLTWGGDKTLLNPVQNVKFGIAYLYYLRGRYQSRSNFYLTAYNRGIKHLHLSQRIPKHHEKYSHQVIERYIQYYFDLRKILSEAS